MSFLETDKDYSKKLPGKKSRKELEDKAIRKVNSLIETKGQVKARINIYCENCWVRRRLLQPERVGNFWNNNYIKYESNCNKNKTLSVK